VSYDQELADCYRDADKLQNNLRALVEEWREKASGIRERAEGGKHRVWRFELAAQIDNDANQLEKILAQDDYP
jgi:hypothetical protein